MNELGEATRVYRHFRVCVSNPSDFHQKNILGEIMVSIWEPALCHIAEICV